MAPMSLNIAEMAVFGPVQSLMINESWLKAWTTNDQVDAAVHRLLVRASKAGSRILSTDFESFDASLGPGWRTWARKLQHRLMKETPQTGELLEALEHVASNIPLMVQMDNIITGEHGEPSGIVFTNWDDSVSHRFAQHRIENVHGVRLDEDTQVQGDDGLLATYPSLDAEAVTRVYADLGLRANPDKQFEGEDDCLYLQRYHHISKVGGMYPTYRALNSLLGQERYHDPEKWDARMVTLRAIMILENTKHHPLFQEFVAFVQSGDKYRLGASYPGGIQELLSPGLLSTAAELAGFIPSYNQEGRLGGICEFATYKLIKEGE